MNKKLFFLFLTIVSTQRTYSMIQAYDHQRHVKRYYGAINLKELAQTNMTILGALPFGQACKKVHKLNHSHNYLSDNQELFLNILALPFDLSLPILFGKDYYKKQAMMETFCSQPVGKALELYYMLAEKYAKDKKLASLISFDELYANYPSYIELYDAVKYFSHNQKATYQINGEQLKKLIVLPDGVKKDSYFNDKNFLITANYQELMFKNLKNFIWTMPIGTIVSRWDGASSFMQSIIAGNFVYCFFACFTTSVTLDEIAAMKPAKIFDLKYPWALRTFAEQIQLKIKKELQNK